MIEYFEKLEVSPGATADEVRTSYLQLIKVWHPDRFSGDDTLVLRAVRKTQEINEAYEQLQAFFANGGNAKGRATQTESETGKRKYKVYSQTEANDEYAETIKPKPKRPFWSWATLWAAITWPFRAFVHYSGKLASLILFEWRMPVLATMLCGMFAYQMFSQMGIVEKIKPIYNYSKLPSYRQIDMELIEVLDTYGNDFLELEEDLLETVKFVDRR